MDIAVKIKRLSITLGGNLKVLSNIDLELPVGKTVALIGPSGAGKTTLIKSIVGRLQTPKDSVQIFGQPAGSPSLRETVSYMTQELSVYFDLTIRENLIYFATMSGQSRSMIKQSVKALLEMVDLPSKADSLVSDLSGGQKQRVSLAIALIGHPKLIVLDEPTAGLDPVLRDKLWRLFAQLTEQGMTLIVSSHSMDEAERCDDLILIREGKLIAHSSPGELLERTRSVSVEQAFLKLAGDNQT